jgi:ParB family transcriptional regulator, chromosome partitioning protein
MTSEAPKNKKTVRPALGRGLGSLISTPPVPIPELAPTAVGVDVQVQNADIAPTIDGNVRFVSIDILHANPKQPRQYFAEAELLELASSIRTLGVLQPVLVRQSKERAGEFEIIAGERRYRASKLAGLQTVPVSVKDLSDREVLEISIVENVQRQGLNPVEEAVAYQRLIEEFNLSVTDVATRVGKDRVTVSNIVRILRLPTSVLELVKNGSLSLGHAKAILTVKEPAAQQNLANKVLAENMSVRSLEAIVSRSVVLDPMKPVITRVSRGPSPTAGAERTFDEVNDLLRNALGTKVVVRKTGESKGVVELHYFSDSELERLVETLIAKKTDSL